MTFWTQGNQIRILECGEQYYPALIEAIDLAQTSISFECYIFYADSVGQRIADAFLKAAKRGVRVQVLLDGFGSAKLNAEFRQRLRSGGVNLQFFRENRHFLELRRRFFRRLHRKVMVVDRELAFVGGLNVGEDHLFEKSRNSKFDFAVEVKGPLVEDVARVAELFFLRIQHRWKDYFKLRASRAKPLGLGPMQAAFVVRDNFRYRRQIENHYVRAIGKSRNHVTLASAYFFPKVKILRALREASDRGVEVKLILQGQIEFLVVKWATEALYAKMLRHKIRVFEYDLRVLHAKAATVDSSWATVGSCNLDPISLLLNLESNVIVSDEAFAADLKNRLDGLIVHGCREVLYVPPPAWKRLRNYICYLALRWIPSLAGAIPALKSPPDPNTSDSVGRK